MNPTTPTLCALLAFAAPAWCQTFNGAVDTPAGSAQVSLGARLATAGSLIGDHDPAINPGGTQTRPGLFGGSGNQPIPATVDFNADAAAATQPAGTLGLTLDFEAGTIRIADAALDLLSGSEAAADLSATLLFNTFNTVNPTFIYIGGTPITVPLGQLAAITRAELGQTGPAQGFLTPTADPDVFDFSADLPAEAYLTLSITPPGSDPISTDLDALPVDLPVSGRITRLGDGSVRVTVSAATDLGGSDLPLPSDPLPTIPVSLPTLGSATANVLLTLVPESLAADTTIAVELVVLGEPTGCDADLTGDGLLNFFDLAAYMALYNDQNPAADLAPPTGLLNFFDLAAYLDLYNTGCP